MTAVMLGIGAVSSAIGGGLKIAGSLKNSKKDEEKKQEEQEMNRNNQLQANAARWAGSGGNNADKAMFSQNSGDAPLYGGNGLTPMDVFRRRS